MGVMVLGVAVEGSSVGDKEGEQVGSSVGALVGSAEGRAVGTALGVALGAADGAGVSDGCSEGTAEALGAGVELGAGEPVGSGELEGSAVAEGWAVALGAADGTSDGTAVGPQDGTPVVGTTVEGAGDGPAGCAVGRSVLVGLALGLDGRAVGAKEGALVIASYDNFCTRLFPPSLTNMFPTWSMITPDGLLNEARFAIALSLWSYDTAPSPANVSILPEATQILSIL